MRVEKFLFENKLNAECLDIHKFVEDFTGEMNNGLKRENGSLRMIPTYIESDNEFLTDVSVLAIDAGGTNYRFALMKISNEKKYEISCLGNARMPGLEGEISKDDFFNALAEPLKPLVDKAARVGFCFSYPTEIFPSKDGKLLQFCKEVQASEVIGQLVGKSLLDSLGATGKPIVLLNDTVATLLAGKLITLGRKYDSFIGFILGTGTNTCYIEKNTAFTKNINLDPDKSQIVNIESGNFVLAPRTALDVAFDNTTMNPGQYTFEKMISGGYLGGLCLFVLKVAANEMVFCPDTSRKISAIPQLTTEQLNYFAGLPKSGQEPITDCFATSKEEGDGRKIVLSLIERAAKLVAANLAAVILKTGKGKSEEAPVLITIEGSTFYKLCQFRTWFEKYLHNYFSGSDKRFYEFAEVPQSSLVGAGLAGLIE